jgi:exosortase
MDCKQGQQSVDNESTTTEKKSIYNWGLAAQFFVLFLVIGLLFNESIQPMVTRWIKWHEDLSHAIPTILAVLFLALRTEKFSYKHDSKVTRGALIGAIAFLSLTWMVFAIANITLFANLIILLCIPFIFAASYSVRTAYFFVPIIGVLLFTIPIFGKLNGYLVLMSSHTVGFLVHLVGMTALIDGQNIYLPSGHIFIADGCSGIRYLTISILLSYLLSILNNYNLRQTLYTFTLAIVLALLTNWIRIFALVVIGDITEMKSSLMHDHETLGWVLFAVIMLPAIFFSPIHPKKIVTETEAPKLKPILPLLALAIGPIFLNITPNLPQTTTTFSLQTLALNEYDNTRTLFREAPLDGYEVEHGSLRVQDIDMQVQLAHHRAVKTKEKIIPYFDSLFNKQEWQITRDSTPEALKKLGFKANILKHTQSQSYQLFIYRLEIGASNTSSYETAKILQIPASISGKRYFNIFSISSECENQSCTNEITTAAALATQWDTQTKQSR